MGNQANRHDATERASLWVRFGRWLSIVIRADLIRIILAFLAVGAAANIVRLVLTAVHPALGLGPLNQATLQYAIPVVLAIHFTYLGFVRFVERRGADELGREGAVAEAGKGVAVGAALFAASVGIVAALGYYSVVAVNPWTALLPPLSMALASAYTEELLFRGVLLRIAEEFLGTWIALLGSSALFALIHAANPNATLFSVLAIFLEAGILLGAAYILTRRLWLAIGIHFAWNFTQGGIFGVNVSGTSIGGLFDSELSGPPLLSGGRFGIETSVFAVVPCLAAGIVLLVQANRKGRFLAPGWKR